MQNFCDELVPLKKIIVFEAFGINRSFFLASLNFYVV